MHRPYPHRRLPLRARGLWWMHPSDQCRQSERTHQSASLVTGHRAGIEPRNRRSCALTALPWFGGLFFGYRLATAEPSDGLSVPVFSGQCAESCRMRRILVDSASAAASQRRVLEPLGGSPGRTAAVGHQPRRAIPRRAYRSALVSSPSCRAASASHHRAPRRRPLMGEGCRQAERHRAPHPHRRPVDTPGRPPSPPRAGTGRRVARDQPDAGCAAGLPCRPKAGCACPARLPTRTQL